MFLMLIKRLSKAWFTEQTMYALTSLNIMLVGNHINNYLILKIWEDVIRSFVDLFVVISNNTTCLFGSGTRFPLNLISECMYQVEMYEWKQRS
jgi:hypothetical protein